MEDVTKAYLGFLREKLVSSILLFAFILVNIFAVRFVLTGDVPSIWVAFIGNIIVFQMWKRKHWKTTKIEVYPKGV